MCATSHPLAAQVAVRMLQDGGNAVDAAIAAAVLLGFCEPQMCGLGGDCFVLLKPPGEERLVGLNGSGRAPAGLDAGGAARRRARRDAAAVGHAVTVPGAVDAFARLAADWGRLGLAACLAPAIGYAEAGVPVAPRTAWDWHERRRRAARRRAAVLPARRAGAGARASWFRAPEQAEVLRRIARDGRAGFYEGEVAADMVDSLRALGGAHTLEDFAATACDYVEPIAGGYRGHELVELPPNGQGATAILLARILARFDLARARSARAPSGRIWRRRRPSSPTTRATASSPIPAPGRCASSTCWRDATAERLAALIDPGRALPSPAAAAEAVHRETVYLCVVDRDRMAVSLIYSTFHSFGSGLASARFGINFHSRGAGFTLTPGPSRTRPAAASGRCTPSSRRCCGATGGSSCRSA